MKMNEAGLALLKKWEGFRASAYLCPAQVWTIGYGHTDAAGPPRVRPGMKVTRSEATDILRRDLGQYEQAVQDAIGYDAAQRCSANQFSAMTSLCYNIGAGAFKRSSVARHFRNGDIAASEKAFHMWRKGGGRVLKGLVNRRKDEARLFRTKDGKRVPSSPSEVAGGTAAGVGVGGVAAKAVQDGLISTEIALAVVAVSLGLIAAIIFFRRNKT